MNNNHSIDPGRFRSLLRLEAKDALPDGYGGYTDNYELVADIWASISSVANQISEHTGNLHSNGTHRITLRWRGDCKAEMRFVHNNRIFAINGVRDPQENKRYLICDCEEVL